MKKSKPNTGLIQLLNRCRIYLQLITVSDMANIEGTEVSPHYFKGQRDPNRTIQLTWPSQNKIYLSCWKVWKKETEQTYLYPNTLTLKQKLGKIFIPQDYS